MVKQQLSNAQPDPVWTKAAMAGFIGTWPMTVFMLLTQRLLPRGQRYALPPEIITKEFAERAHLRVHMSKKQGIVATLIAHFGYGAAMGALYSPLQKEVSLPPAMKGATFGLLVWGGSYLALLPLLGLSESAQRETLRRNLLMIGAHLVWGSVMGIVAEKLQHSEM